MQKEHQEKLCKLQQEEKQRLEQLALKEMKDEPIYDQSSTLVVRPGKKSKLPKISVGIDATPATRTESIFNQIPIELEKDIAAANKYETNFNNDQLAKASEVVVIEHHHSRSDPLPMETILKTMMPNFSTPRIYEPDSASANSLYARINPKSKSRLHASPSSGLNMETPPLVEQSNYENLPDEEIYMTTGPMTTFGTGDVNVTSREPMVERECISPEEALRTIKRRNYPKVLPDIEKRRSLPVPSSLFLPRQYAGSLKDYKNTNRMNLLLNQPPLPPPRIFGASKSLEFVEENEIRNEDEPITTNLHVGPLLKKQDTCRNNSDPSIIDSYEEGKSIHVGGSVDTIYTNPNCPLHGFQSRFSPISQSMDIGKPGNPNWYKPMKDESSAMMVSAASEPHIITRAEEKQLLSDATVPKTEPRICITPRLNNPTLAYQDLLTRSDDKMDRDPGRNDSSMEGLNGLGGLLFRETERREPRVIITAREPNHCASVSNLKYPKIIIRPTATLPRLRDQRNIPKVSAIPSPEQQNCQNIERDKALEHREIREKPPLREKPRVTKIPSFCRRREEAGLEKPSYVEKTEILQQRTTDVGSSKVANLPSTSDIKSSIPIPATTTGTAIKSEKSSSTDSSSNGNSSNSNTGTIKRKPSTTSKK